MRALRVAMSTVIVCALAGCHDDWEEVYAQCVRDGRCGGGSGDDGGTVDAGPMPSLSFSGSIDFGASGRDGSPRPSRPPRPSIAQWAPKARQR